MSPRAYDGLSSTAREQNCGQPDATFISDFGIWKLLLSSSGWKDLVMSRDTPSWARRERETVCLKGQGRSGSNSPFMRVMKKEICVPQPEPSPLR